MQPGVKQHTAEGGATSTAVYTLTTSDKLKFFFKGVNASDSSYLLTVTLLRYCNKNAMYTINECTSIGYAYTMSIFLNYKI